MAQFMRQHIFFELDQNISFFSLSACNEALILENTNALSAVGTKGQSCRLDVCLFCVAIGVHIQVFLVGGWLLEHFDYDA
jgi:hypothetical protein